MIQLKNTGKGSKDSILKYEPLQEDLVVSCHSSD